MTLSPAELDALIHRIAEAVADRLASRPRLVDRVELARVLGCSVPTIERLQRAGAIPIVRIGSRVLYDPAACVAALSQPVAAPGLTSDPRSEYRVVKSAGQP